MDKIQRIGVESGLENCEFFSLSGRGFYHTYDCFQDYINLTIDEQYVYGQVGGTFPDVYRGGKKGEVYVTSYFPDGSYKASFSADTGHTFRVVYHSDHTAYDEGRWFMSDRKAGDFYIVKLQQIETQNPYGWYIRLCIEYYRDYGETLVDTYCHELTREGVVTAIVEEPLSDKVTIYPNPTKGKIQVRGDGLQVTGIELFDLLGRKVLEQNTEGKTQCEVDMSKLPAGIYFVRIQTEKEATTQKIVKQ